MTTLAPKEIPINKFIIKEINEPLLPTAAAGMIGSLAAQGINPFRAAVCGVYAHGLAGDRTAKRLSETTMLPTDMIEDISF